MAKKSTRWRQIENVFLLCVGRVKDVGPLVVYVAADESAFTSGIVMQVAQGSPMPLSLLVYCTT